MSDVADTTPSGEGGHDPVLELRVHIEQALVALDELREHLSTATWPDRDGS